MSRFNKILLYLSISFISITINSQSASSKREFRGAWIATVVNLDWPSTNLLTSEEQKEELIELFDKLEQTNINAVIFQIRTECDAFYNSSFDPWSYWLTGEQGIPPSPYYDPLEFAIEEAHKRGMEIHAWFNPYRVERDAGNYATSTNHISNTHPEWVIQIGNIKFLNPGLIEVREYVTNVVMDVVRRYDIDGIHFDDYFYPYPPNEITNEDFATHASDPRGFFDIKQWRRDNINELLRMINEEIKNTKPHIKFGISPFGIYKNGVPSGIVGLDAYNVIYCDPIKWLDEEIIDYLTPQLYWSFGGGQDYGKLLEWWSQQVNSRHLYPGQALYRAGIFEKGELPKQIRLNRDTENVYGNILFRADNLFDNLNGITDSLQNLYFAEKAIIPQMNWKDSIIPLEPRDLRFDALKNSRGDGLIWETPQLASDGDSASRYILYNFDNLLVDENDINDSKNIFRVQNNRTVKFSDMNEISEQMFFAVSSLDKNNNESSISDVIEVKFISPEIPMLFAPNNNALNQKDTTKLIWNNSLHSSFNSLQISSDSNYLSNILEYTEIMDTFLLATGLDGLSKYYWRVSAANVIGESNYSESRSFTTGFPTTPVLNSPIDEKLDVSINPILIWNNLPEANKYHIQLANGLSLSKYSILSDTLVQDTSIIILNLLSDNIYSWRVRANNEYGFGKWSAIFKFKTGQVTGIDENSIPIAYNLDQNYPNPFNSETTISFSIPKEGYVSLKVYNMLGQEVGNLFSRTASEGHYKVQFNAKNLSSGTYFYTLNIGDFRVTKKMIYLK